MPFTLAHAAAVLPLRRFCPRFLSFPALVVGSLCPDAGYAFAWLGADELAHGFVGSFAFCLPVGLVLLGLFKCGVRSAECGMFQRVGISLRSTPESRDFAPLSGRACPEEAGLRSAHRPYMSRGVGSLAVLVLSLLVGAWTHLLWDSFTNNQGWAVLHLALLQEPVAAVGNHQVRVCHLLWYASSFAGVGWLYVAYAGWRRATAGTAVKALGRTDFAIGTLCATAGLVIGGLHHLVSGPLGTMLVGALSLLLIAAGLFVAPHGGGGLKPSRIVGYEYKPENRFN